MTRRTVLISGANRGIGAAIARRLHADGWALSLGMRNPARPDWDGDGAAHLFRYDAREGSEATWIAEAAERFGRIDAVIPSAGIMTPGSVIEAADADIDLLMDVNLKAPRRMVQAAWPHLQAAEAGRVIILASLSGKRVKSAQSGLYSVCKFAVVGLAHAIRHAGWDDGTRATAVCPSLVNTDMAHAISDLDGDRMVDPVALARGVSFLLEMPNHSSVAEFHVNCGLETDY